MKDAYIKNRPIASIPIGGPKGIYIGKDNTLIHTRDNFFTLYTKEATTANPIVIDLNKGEYVDQVCDFSLPNNHKAIIDGKYYDEDTITFVSGIHEIVCAHFPGLYEDTLSKITKLILSNTISDYSDLNTENYSYENVLIPEIIIPEGVTDLYLTFFNCTDGFLKPIKLPNSLLRCNGVFSCSILTEPIELPPNVIECGRIFCDNSFVTIPDWFKIPNKVINCYEMFNSNTELIDIGNFVIPASVTDCNGIFSECSKLTSGTITIENTNITVDGIKNIIAGTQLSEIRVPVAFKLTDDEIKNNCGKSDVNITRY